MLLKEEKETLGKLDDEGKETNDANGFELFMCDLVERLLDYIYTDVNVILHLTEITSVTDEYAELVILIVF